MGHNKNTDFIRLADNISLYRPDPTKADGLSNGSVTIPSESAQPQTIILCAWFRANPKHVAKYTIPHTQRHPNTQILLLESVVAMMLYRPYLTQQHDLSPAVEVVKAAQAAGHRILLHAFSNGGSHTACQLARAWRTRYGTALPVDGMVLDSCPGSGSLLLAGRAIILSFPPGSRWWISVIIWAIIVPMIAAPTLLLGNLNVVEKLRLDLNDPELFPLVMQERGRRVYVYSPKDEMVPVEAVERHAEVAEERGYAVERVKFKSSPHVAHVNEDRERYWGAVDSAMSKG